MKKIVKSAIIGGGAAGLTAAIACSRGLGKNSAVIIEKQPRTGRKLLATGNGRCNISNRDISAEHYHGDKNIINSVIKNFSPSDLNNFFATMGLILREDSEGRIYPYSNQASTVLDCMRRELRRLEAEELCDFNIRNIKKENDKFIISSSEITIIADNIIFATGSQASPLLGADTSGYKLLENLGLETTPLFPALSPIACTEKYSNIKGVRAKGTVSVIADGKNIVRKSGEIQFNEKAVSGICVFEISRCVNEFLEYGKVFGKPCNYVKISADLMPEYTYSELYSYLKNCKKILGDCKASDIFSAALNRKLSQTIAKVCSLDSKLCRNLNDNDIKKLVSTSKNFVFTPCKSDSYKSAQVSAGGIGSKYLYPENLMSRKIPNLFVCGELLDADGDCGGFNLHFAFGSALLASKYIIKENQ